MVEHFQKVPAFCFLLADAENRFGGAVKIDDSAAVIDGNESGMEVVQNIVGIKLYSFESFRGVRQFAFLDAQLDGKKAGDEGHEIEGADVQKDGVEDFVVRLIRRSQLFQIKNAAGQTVSGRSEGVNQGRQSCHRQSAGEAIDQAGGDDGEQEERRVLRCQVTGAADDGALRDQLKDDVRENDDAEKIIGILINENLLMNRGMQQHL